jgi:hypothetical protein
MLTDYKEGLLRSPKHRLFILGNASMENSKSQYENQNQTQNQTYLSRTINGSGWAEMMLPIQLINFEKIRIERPQQVQGFVPTQYGVERPLSRLSYDNGVFHMPTLSLFTSFLKIHDWDSSSGRLELELNEKNPMHLRLISLQNHILGMLLRNQSSWLGTTHHTRESIMGLFQPLISKNILTIYLHGPNPEKRQCGRVWIWNNFVWTKGASQTTFKKGGEIRVGLRLQGLFFLGNPFGNANCRFRLQHQTVVIYQKYVPVQANTMAYTSSLGSAVFIPSPPTDLYDIPFEIPPLSTLGPPPGL